MAKMTLKTAKELLERGIIQQEDFDQLVQEGSISLGRQPKGTLLAMKNMNDIYVSPQLYFKNNSGGVKSETDEMKELRQKVYALFEDYCEEIKIEEIDDDSDGVNDEESETTEEEDDDNVAELID